MPPPAQDRSGREYVEDQMGEKRCRPGGEQLPIERHPKCMGGNPEKSNKWGKDQKRMSGFPMGPPERDSPEAGDEIDIG